MLAVVSLIAVTAIILDQPSSARLGNKQEEPTLTSQKKSFVISQDSWPGGWSPDQWRNGSPNGGGVNRPSKSINYGTAQCSFSGRTGRLSITNDTPYLVFFDLYHPDTGRKFRTQELSAGSSFTSSFAIGDDWGITFQYAGFSDRQIRCIGNVTDLSGGLWRGYIKQLTRSIPKI